MTMSDIVEIASLTKTFNGQTALDNLSLSLPQGKITGLVGPDGAGKTTLIRVITGLMEPDSGSVRVAGWNVFSGEKSNLAGLIGYMPQKFGLYEDLSVLENLRLYARLHDLSAEEEASAFEKMLEFTDLKRFTGRLAGRLSGGMKQKLGLACALLGHPGLLLLDEPGVGVDPVSRRELWAMVKSLMDGRMSILWSTSYLDEAERCDKVILLNEGKILFSGVPADLTSRLEGRVMLFQPKSGDKRRALGGFLRRNDVADAVIQGASIRLVFRCQRNPGTEEPAETSGLVKMEKLAETATQPVETVPSSKLSGVRPFSTEEKEAEDGVFLPVRPRFEDAFMDLLGGSPPPDSALAGFFPDCGRGSEIVVRADSLTKRYGSFTAADRISFRIRRGEIFGLLGPNGAGKSTTFKMLCGLIRASSGSASIEGFDLMKSASLARSRIGYMAQKFSLYEGLSLKQNLDFFAGIYGLSGKRAAERIGRMTEIFGFKEYLNENAGDLPLGFKQRLSLACAVMHNPSVLFLDEPTSGVSPVTRREFWIHINSLVEKGVTVMITTHFMEEAEYCDRISLIYRGEAIAEGTPDELKARVRDEFARPDPTMEDAFIDLVSGGTSASSGFVLSSSPSLSGKKGAE